MPHGGRWTEVQLLLVKVIQRRQDELRHLLVQQGRIMAVEKEPSGGHGAVPGSDAAGLRGLDEHGLEAGGGY